MKMKMKMEMKIKEKGRTHKTDGKGKLFDENKDGIKKTFTTLSCADFVNLDDVWEHGIRNEVSDARAKAADGDCEVQLDDLTLLDKEHEEEADRPDEGAKVIRHLLSNGV